METPQRAKVHAKSTATINTRSRKAPTIRPWEEWGYGTGILVGAATKYATNLGVE